MFDALIARRSIGNVVVTAGRTDVARCCRCITHVPRPAADERLCRWQLLRFKLALLHRERGANSAVWTEELDGVVVFLGNVIFPRATSIGRAELSRLDVHDDAIVGKDRTPRAIITTAGYPITIVDIVLRESAGDDLQFGPIWSHGSQRHMQQS